MKRQILLMLPTLLLGLAAFTHAVAFEKQSDGVLFQLKKIKPTDPRLLKVQVCSPDIIRIIASPADSFSTRASLMVQKSTWEPFPWDVRESNGQVEITTAKVIVRVNPETGAVVFCDTTGHPILSEKNGGGKIITSADVLGEQTYHIQQLFDSPADEAFYGLGGNQNAIMNYRGHNLDLYQHNMEEVVPFLVSNKNYGILWDNNSHMKFGDVRDYQPLNTLKLYAKDGTEGGLTAEYFRDMHFDSLYVSRQESSIDYEYTDAHEPYPEGFQKNVTAVRWSGEIEAREPGTYEFRLCSCGYTKLWVDGTQVVESWRQNWLPWTHFPRIQLEAGKRHSIKLEWIHTGGLISLSCMGPLNPVYDTSLSLWSEVADQIDYYFVRGDNLDKVVHGYREITGRAPMMPNWALGFWQSREHYASQDEILSVVGEFRKRQIPLDNIVQDWFYWKEDKWGDHEFDPSRYPDPAGMVRTLHQDLHAHIMISVWAKFYVGTKNFEEFKKHGWLYLRNVEKGQRDWVGPGYVSTFYDPYSAGARDLFWKQINETLFSKGIDAWWLDCTEPDIQSNLSRRETILRQGPTALGSSSRYLNTFSLMQTKAVYENQRAINPNQRVFILTRSAFAGTQRYAAATWSGDIAARWYDMKAQISGGANFCLAGVPYWTMDIGGFAVEQRYERPTPADLDEWRELNTRWYEFGSFCPLFRVHGQFPYREMFNIAPETHPAYQAMLKYDRLRYRLMPYIYSLAGMVTQDDYTIMRALVMDFGNDPKVLTINDQYMFGPALLINPVTEYKARTREVYLPGDGWYELQSGKYFKGGETIQANAPYSDIPVFVKKGSIIPTGPEIQYTGQKSADTTRVFVYSGGNAAFSLYEDEGVNYNYEKGLFSTIPLTYDENTHALTIGARKGSFPGMLQHRVFEVVWVNNEHPKGLDFSAPPDASVQYNGTETVVKMSTQH